MDIRDLPCCLVITLQVELLRQWRAVVDLTREQPNAPRRPAFTTASHYRTSKFKTHGPDAVRASRQLLISLRAGWPPQIASPPTRLEFIAFESVRETTARASRLSRSGCLSFAQIKDAVGIASFAIDQSRASIVPSESPEMNDGTARTIIQSTCRRCGSIRAMTR